MDEHVINDLPSIRIQSNASKVRSTSTWINYGVDDEDPLLEINNKDDEASIPGEVVIVDAEENVSTKIVSARLLHRSEIVILMLSYLGINLMFLILSVEMVPAQVVALVGSQNKASFLGALVAMGAVVTFFSGPLIGMASDRLVTPFGRRRPIMVLSSIILSFGLIGMALSVPKVIMDQTMNETDIINGTCRVDLVQKRCQRLFNESHANADFNGTKGFVYEEKPLGGHTGLFIFSYFVVIFAYVAILTPYNALVADRSHHDQRGLNSGVMGGMILTGNIGGAAMGLLIVPFGVVWVYIIATIIVLLCLSITVVFTPESLTIPPTVTQLSLREAVRGFWLPLRDHDFRWVFITRFLMQMGFTSVVGFLEYWLSDMVILPNCWSPFKGLSFMLLPLLIFAAIASVLTGILSDRMGIRKPLVIIASIIMGSVSITLALLRGDLAYYFSFGLAIAFGMAFGGYQAVDFALLMDVLPDPDEKSRDIAVWQQALVLPQAIAIPIGGVIIDLFQKVNCQLGLGYIIMFIITGLYFYISGFFVSRIRGSS